MGSAQRTLGIGATFNGGGSALRRFEKSLLYAWHLDDPASSTEIAPVKSGLGPALTVKGTITFGATAMIQGLTCATLTDAGNSNAVGGYHVRGPSTAQDFTCVHWFRSSESDPGGSGSLGWAATGSATNRLVFAYNVSSPRVYILEANTERASYTLPTDWATDLGDGSAHMFAWGRVGSNWYTYLDGSQVGTSSAAPTADASLNQFQLSADGNWPDSDLGPLFIFGSGPNATAISELWNSGSGLILRT